MPAIVRAVEKKNLDIIKILLTNDKIDVNAPYIIKKISIHYI